MKYTWKFLLSAAFSILLLVAASRSWQIGNTQIPATGSFINPFTGFWNQAESGKSGSHERYRSGHIGDSIRIEFDRRMVPYIYATRKKDAFYAQGLLHAKHRLFQMDLTARSIEGRLSELLGKATLEKDIFARRIDFGQAIENKYLSWKNRPEIMEFAEAYVAGVNDYIDGLQARNYPIEYKLLNAKPTPWSVRRVIAVSLSLSATLNMNLQDYQQTNTRMLLGEKTYNHLYPLFPDSLHPVVPYPETYPDTPRAQVAPEQDFEDFEFLQGIYPRTIDPGIGSNNWAVRAALTRDSVPMLANDPHLDLTLPSIWYELQLHAPELSVHGVSVPGMPGIIIGFNEHTAWGVTNVSIDVLDTYKIKWADRDKHTYYLDDEEVPAKVRDEIIHVKGQPDHKETIYETYWGPILYKDQPDRPAQNDVAVKWISQLPADQCDFASIYGFMRAQNLEDYLAALEDFYIPAQNIVFASADDSIAITVQGKFPIKKQGQGRFIMDGSKTENDWHGYIPQSDLPQVINPEDGFVLSANQWSTYPEYPYYYSGRFNHYRGREIAGYLRRLQPLTPEKMQNIQNDTYNLQAAEMIPLLISLLNSEIRDDPLIDSLLEWDYHYVAESTLPTLTELWLEECMNYTFDEIALLPDSFPVMMPEIWRLKSLLEKEPYDPVFDLKSTKNRRENARDIVLLAWESAREKFNELPAAEKAWGRYASLSVQHLLQLPAFSHQNLFTGGNGNTINAITRRTGPSWKMIVELYRDSVQARVIYPGGQSGNPGSRYYDNFLEDWLHGLYYPVSIRKKPQDIPQPLHYTISITPKS